MVSHCGFYLHLCNINDNEHHFMSLLAIYIYLRNVNSDSCPFLNGIVFILRLSQWFSEMILPLPQ